MAQTVNSASLVGVQAVPISVEVDVAGGLPAVAIVGLADAAVREARVRVQAALQHGGFSFPVGRISVNLAPANLRKDGTGFDLPIALGILLAQGVLAPEAFARTLVLGELSLNGEVRPVRGVLAAAEAARAAGFGRLLVAADNAAEAALVGSLEVRAVRSLTQAVAWFRGDGEAAPLARPAETPGAPPHALDLSDVRGQETARRALEVAAAGGHNLLFIGGPGSGKTMLARRLPSILPPLDDESAVEVTRVHSVAGLARGGLLRERPFRAPHHSTTPAGLVGGGAGVPRPGELSLAHRGVLFLDELPEFCRATLEVLRQPLEAGEVVVARAWGNIRFPAEAQLVCAMNPCPCGRLGDPRRPCRCLASDVARYRGRISGPLLDRIDLQVQVPPVKLADLEGTRPGEPSTTVRARVLAARARQEARLGPGRTNATMTPGELLAHAQPGREGAAILREAVERVGLSARGYERTLRVARTLADLAGTPSIEALHVREAAYYRGD